MVGPTRYVLPLAEQEATMVSDVGVTLFSEKRAVKAGWRRQAWSTGGQEDSLETGHIPAKGDPVILCDFVVTGTGRARWLGDRDAASSGGARDADGGGAARAVRAGRPVGSGSR